MTSSHFPLGPVTGYFHEDNARRFTLTADFRYVDGSLDLTIPQGYETDLNSVPEPLWAYFSPWDVPEAGLVHDWLYDHPGAMSRASCDGVHRRVLEIKGVRWSKRWAIYLALRLGGGVAWNRHRAEDQ